MSSRESITHKTNSSHQHLHTYTPSHQVVQFHKRLWRWNDTHHVLHTHKEVQFNISQSEEITHTIPIQHHQHTPTNPPNTHKTLKSHPQLANMKWFNPTLGISTPNTHNTLHTHPPTITLHHHLHPVRLWFKPTLAPQDEITHTIVKWFKPTLDIHHQNIHTIIHSQTSNNTQPPTHDPPTTSSTLPPPTHHPGGWWCHTPPRCWVNIVDSLNWLNDSNLDCTWRCGHFGLK